MGYSSAIEDESKIADFLILHHYFLLKKGVLLGE